MFSNTLNRAIWAFMLIALVVLGYKTRDDLETYFAGVCSLEVGEVTSDGTMPLRWRGKIDAPMESRIAEAFERHKGVAQTFVLTLSSPGGTLDHGARVIQLLRKIGETHGLETVVEAGRRCASMCVPVYLQGQRRLAAAGAKFMFHEVSFREYLSKDASDVPVPATETATDRLFNDYFAPAGVPVSWISKVRSEMAGGHDIWKSGRELADENAGIVLEVRE